MNLRRSISRSMAALVLASIQVGCNEEPPPPPRPVQAPPPIVPPQLDTPKDWSHEKLQARYALLLEECVAASGLVDYVRLRSVDIRSIAQAFGNAYAFDSTNEELAFLCNAYNAHVLDLVDRASRAPEFESVIKIEGFFDATEIVVGGKTMTLNELENDRIRPYGDARIHAALVCAAVSCPPLRAEPFDGARLDEQFDEQCRRWVNDETKFAVTADGVSASQILNWHGEDFVGAPWNGVAGFIRAYATAGSELQQAVADGASPTISWMEYDWSPNATRIEEESK